MTLLSAASIALAICAPLLNLNMASAQQTTPRNGTLVPPNAPQIKLTSSQTAMQYILDIDPLTATAGANASVQQLQAIQIGGVTVLTRPENVADLGVGNIAYISCDPSTYSGGNVDAPSLLRTAALQIVGPNPANDPQGAIVLYSTTSDYCSFAPDQGFLYQWMYTSVNSTAAAAFEKALQNNQSNALTTIQLDQSTLNGNAINTLGPSPTTAVAMIILYSITGIITALFLIIIVTGAIRAHRHPERYGPRALVGRPRQSRAKGIARAMLETLPIVKFGDHEDINKPMPAEGDVELGEACTPRNTAANTDEAGAPSKKSNPEGSEGSEGGDIVRTATAGAAESSHEHKPEHEGIQEEEHNHGDGHEHPVSDQHFHPAGAGDHGSDNGLACSVCTEDFVKGDDIRVLPCGHKYHPECIDPWLLNVSGTCPLCRIDLRPTASHTEEGEGRRSSMPDVPDMPDMPTSLMPAEEHPESSMPTSRRRAHALSSYIHHTLNPRRMRDATPEERLAALRQFRTTNRASGGDSNAGMGLVTGERTRSRVTARLNRLWPHSVHGARNSVVSQNTEMPESSQGSRRESVVR